MSRVVPTNNEKSFDDDEIIVSKTDTKGRITYGNHLFIKLSGYREEELLGAPHNIIRHPHMPAAVFKLLWDTVATGKEIFAYVKNLSKDGSFYWVFANVTPSYDENDVIIGYHSVRRKPSKEQIDAVSKLYSELLAIEERSGLDASVDHLLELLNSKGVSYEQFILSV